MQFPYYIVNVFTEERFGGNPLAVVLDADGLSHKQMQAIAADFNLSETTFIHPASNDDAQCDIRIFTPTTELPIAGHPIIGSIDVLVRDGRLAINSARQNYQVRVKAGNVPVRIEQYSNEIRQVWFSAPVQPEFDNEVPSAQAFAEVLGISTEYIDIDKVQRVYHGNWTLIVPINDYQILSTLQPNIGLWRQVLTSYAHEQFYAVHIHEKVGKDDVSARMFFPESGINEDPATGSAAISLAAYLANKDRQYSGGYSWQFSQGRELNRPSTIYAHVAKEAGRIVAVRIGGSSVLCAQGVLDV